jgi:ADP-ribosylglycohydrolase
MRDTFFEPANLARAEAEQAQEAGYPFNEPSAYEAICAVRPAALPVALALPGEASLHDRMLGALLGRAVGCQLGKHFEGMPRADIETYLRSAGEWPADGTLHDYVPLLASPPVRIIVPSPQATRGNFAEMARDDDMDYPLIGLHILEKYGAGFTIEDVAFTWLSLLPYQMVFTAERAAYRNIVNELPVTQTATHDNPYREWIGAQIRADAWAYASASLPERAARWAWQDASLSHVKNGIYGELWAAAMIAAAFDDTTAPIDGARIRALLDIGLAAIPARCRLADALRQLDAWHAGGIPWEAAFDRVRDGYGGYHWVHTINNALVVALALLYGGGDFSRTISLAVLCGWDTDCNGATAGSILGAMLGAGALPTGWTAPLNDRLRSAVIGFDGARFSDLARRFVALRLALTDPQE